MTQDAKNDVKHDYFVHKTCCANSMSSNPVIERDIEWHDQAAFARSDRCPTSRNIGGTCYDCFLPVYAEALRSLLPIYYCFSPSLQASPRFVGSVSHSLRE
mmetsp:Transcript_22457/g.43711  ORF Transcript_22457/g.43711 Transcript_22457/m.43711 type:complete len:101 (+) Transcript_22457:244-546(+)